MKKNLFCMWLMLLAILFSVNTQAQMTIGGKKKPEAFSVLELLNKGGLRLPQMTTAERDAFAVKNNDKGNGLTIYNKTTDCVEYWNKTRWVSLCEGTSQTTISPQPCVNIAADGSGCDSQFSVTDPDCPNGPFNISIMAGSEYASLSEVDNVNGKFKINFFTNETVNIHTVLVRVTSTCTSMYKEFLFSQKGVDCSSMSYTVPAITASGTALCTGGSVYLSVPVNTANLDKLIWTRNGAAVARGVNYYVATQAGKYNISMGAVGCNTNAVNEKTISESATTAPANISILATNNGVLCGTNSVTLSASGTISAGSIAWFHNGVEEKSGTTAVISGDSSVGEWFAVVKDGSCYSKQSNSIQITKSQASGQITIADADVLVNGQPLKTFTTFCSGGSLDLSIANKQTGITYTWYNGNDIITSNPYIVPSSQSTISLRMVASDNSGAKCPAEQRVLDANIITGSTPAISVIDGNSNLCDGKTVLTIIPKDPGSYTYTWYKDNVKMSETAAAINVTTEGAGAVYSATITNATGCSSPTASKTVSIQNSSRPVVSWSPVPAATATFGAVPTFGTTSSYAPTSYVWTMDGVVIPNTTGANATIQLPKTGTEGQKVVITVTAKNGCGDSDPLVQEITMNSACPTPIITAISPAQTTTAGSIVTVSITTQSTSINNPTYQWYKNTTNSTTGGTPVGTSASSFTASDLTEGVYYFYCKVTNGCTGNLNATSGTTMVTVNKNPATITTGSGTLGGRTCFDIAETEGGTACGTLASRLSQKADFTTTAVNTQVYTFTPSGTVNSVRFDYVESAAGAGKIVDKFVTNGNTVTLTYKSTLSGPQGTAKGLSTATALSVDIYAIYTDGTGEKAVKLTAQIKDCMCCGAMVSATEWRAFMCYNLGVTDTTLNPFKPDYRLKGTAYTPIKDCYVNGKKTAADPCPADYRMPTKAEWDGVTQFNTMTIAPGSISAEGQGGILVGPSLMLPYITVKTFYDGIWNNRQPLGYWSSTGTAANNPYIMVSGYSPSFYTYSISGTYYTKDITMGIRCIAIPDSEK
ncbi:hypothetical protein [Flavobacterium soyae]|uniref:hypothetical protein n=1 Tax=Flavobacterium soyae TaxID=2903098 RepID=UPI001E6527EB|nr:hypothetical protein [Flavobacterium soyae]MCD9574253.1 hypothetical protein [Flavobacterium soyae]